MTLKNLFASKNPFPWSPHHPSTLCKTFEFWERQKEQLQLLQPIFRLNSLIATSIHKNQKRLVPFVTDSIEVSSFFYWSARKRSPGRWVSLIKGIKQLYPISDEDCGWIRRKLANLFWPEIQSAAMFSLPNVVATKTCQTEPISNVSWKLGRRSATTTSVNKSTASLV